MGVIRKTLGTFLAGSIGSVAYLTSATNLTTPLPADDELWSSKSIATFNRHRNPTIQDVVWKRLPLSQIRPELRDNEEALATEFCRGAWSGYAYAPQRLIMMLANRGPKTRDQLFRQQQLAFSKYELGTKFSDHFEVVDRTSNAITVRCGGSPLEPGPRELDGLLVVSAKVDKDMGTVDVSLKTAFFNSVEPVGDGKKPANLAAELLHRLYSRAMVDSGVRRLTR
ncbi:hypothetical protein F4821DRAFT_245602 [Hypoxylon rubiginosum]|uniref:Uncharacterized protein n=1 Tax=Hypoxylon rubiginosum TaxID=110542 RepID=A0ACC0CRK2_9PEZI|nr:hypothetical protein F4821DRAFT_245602 [Hypoxylon rubiginosum]